MRSRYLFTGLVIVAVLVSVRLGLWQLQRLHDRRAANNVAEKARNLPPVVLPGGGPPTPGGRVEATGTFDLAHQFVLRGRAHDGAPGVEIATPLRLEGEDTALVVIRGFVPSDDATSVDLTAIGEEGVVTVRGIGFPIAAEGDSGAPNLRQGTETWRRLDVHALARRLPYPVHAVAIWQEKDSTMRGMPIRLGAPELNDGPHLSYALQWFAFALIFAGGGIVYVRGKRDERGENGAP